MTLEISDYLLTRSILVNNTKEELIESVNDEETFSYMLNSICQLMEEENFILTHAGLCERVSTFINEYRFDYIKNKDYCEKMNYIIGRLQDYNMMSDKRKQDIIDNWVENESEARGLPKCYRNQKNLFELISLDMYYFIGMISFNEPFVVESIIEYASLVNIIMNKFPESFDEDHLFLEVVRHNLECLRRTPLIRLNNLRMVKNTLNKLNKNHPISPEIQLEKSYTLKKTKK